MKKKLFLRLCLMFLIGVSAFSCRTDQFPETETFSNSAKFQLTSQRISLNESKHKTKLLPQLQKAELGIVAFAKNNAQGKIVNYGNGVSIDTDDVVYIEYGPYHTYTFKINRDNAPVDAPVENLILSLEPDGSYKELLKTYHLTQSDWHALSLGNGIDLTGKTTTVEVAKGTYHQALAKGGGSGCYYESQQVYQACCHGEHGEGNIDEWYKCICTGSGLPKMYTIEILVCPPEPGAPTAGWIPTPSSPTAPTGGGSTEGGSTGSESNPANPTDPNTVEGAQGQLGGTPTLPILGGTPKDDSPCGQLKQMGENTNIKTKFTTLKNNINGTNEKGILIRNVAGNETSNVIEGDGEGNIIYPYNTNDPYYYQTYATAHNHLKNNPKHIGIFTPEDLYQLVGNAMIEMNPNNPNASSTPKKSVIFVITDKGFFALKITDVLKLADFIVWYDNMTKEKKKKYMKDIFQDPDEYNIRPTATHDQQVTGFLRFIRDKDIGVELYEGNKDTFGSWRKLNLVDNGNKNYSFNETPCNL
ncbi:hypothetical protein [Chryseobacterium binzhouense]|uniref:hypothetical protein n=1 Tax=Chryseobacterium binzhouense TaxID=2593646 RepID=UPI00289A7690|nr:hypothetical protein [Chryseobacterium binzhouense]